MGVSVNGIPRALRHLSAVTEAIHAAKCVRAVTVAVSIAAQKAADYTPINTGMLLNSQYREIYANGTKIYGRIGYAANYAVYVHDPKIPQKFRRPSARKEFLRYGFEDTLPEIRRAILAELKL